MLSCMGFTSFITKPPVRCGHLLLGEVNVPFSENLKRLVWIDWKEIKKNYSHVIMKGAELNTGNLKRCEKAVAAIFGSQPTTTMSVANKNTHQHKSFPAAASVPNLMYIECSLGSKSLDQ